ncbi:pro-neuregulin-4, membrane-bound isoform-like [Puntigrus tetrazona]|uniref:pro-neuregulin-4, membrane-bound isoform-like n=1 Tax=Puntigrus tetrazona TaxID=1606681 RepID=UPI001C88F71B|nr:pro-neuregulin-4, membrane-bound isoform-like [Puntigrus tetrazona]XP_043084701.1 pro-neuregulin-4, membrane-bound isoform-like [Puntigrus tetrazona]XP_043084702.1 pro-neuregulin-4, membrane-bound isoform-like [Puntigrus tetrazona]XP_043084703.1 pro-neuregulin-4, membrane-bound isoform-like [Puntigrus tetrazona]
MMAVEHGDPCTGPEANFCMNGGTCFKIPLVSTPTCVCSASYEGSRCEQFQLFSFSRDSEEKGMIAAVVIVALLILVVLAVVIYYICKIKRKPRNQAKPEEYWRVRSNSQTV